MALFRTILKSMAVAALASGLLLADFSYEQTSKITGGMIAGMMKVAGAFSRQAREPMRSTVAVKGDRMIQGNEMHLQIIDLGKETITTVDFRKRTWSVMTFAEMAQALERLSEKMKEKQSGEMQFKVSANATGQTRQIGGAEAKEMLLKMEMEGTDAQSGQKGGMLILSHMWMAPKAPGYQEVTDFYRRMAQKLAWTPGTSMFSMGRPDVAKGMTEVYKEMSKMDGMPVLQEINMTVEGQSGSEAQGQAQPTEQPPAQQQAEPAPSLGSALGSALGGRFGLGRRKKKENADQTATAPPPASSSPGSLIEMSTELSNFSAAPVDASRFEVPAGFKQVESDMRRMP
jgi:hypothetical protein